MNGLPSATVSSQKVEHIAIIGAGPAGSVAAIRLAQRGHRVTMYEKATFPRDKVCGECLSATGIAVLRRLGVADRLSAELRPAVLTRTSAVAADGSSMAVALPEPMWGLTRSSMDLFLAERASEGGVAVAFGHAVELDRDAGLRDVHRAKKNHVPEARATFTLIADGIGRSIGACKSTGDFGIKAHFRAVDAPRDTIELIALSAGYAGLAPVNGELWNTAWSVPAASLRKHGGDIDALFRAEVDRSPTLRRRFAKATRVGDWLACPLPRYAVRRHWPANIIPIGNAAAALEPVGGEGMGLAMRSAELAADAIDAAARANEAVDTDALCRAFNLLWRTRRAACRGGAIALSHPFFGPLTVGIGERAPALARIGLTLIGK